MKVPTGTVRPDMKAARIAEEIEIVAARKRAEGRHEQAQELFRLRKGIRETKISTEKAEKEFERLQQ